MRSRIFFLRFYWLVGGPRACRCGCARGFSYVFL
nr:MAG TPA: hypothetical protein [Caudoviricetes sp.]